MEWFVLCDCQASVSAERSHVFDDEGVQPVEAALRFVLLDCVSNGTSDHFEVFFV
jgi:hypothetical protein